MKINQPGGGGGVTTLTGTANQVIVSASTGAITLSTPQNIDTGATPQFARLGLGTAAGATTEFTILQPVRTTGSPTGLSYTGGAHTTLTASSEAIDINFNFARTVQFATGALTTQRAFYIQAPTYAFVGASTITTATTLEISGPPILGTNATFTNKYALNIASGNVNIATGQILLPSGSAATTPALSFSGGNGNAGITGNSAGTIGISLSNANSFTFGTQSLILGQAPSGSGGDTFTLKTNAQGAGNSNQGAKSLLVGPSNTTGNGTAGYLALYYAPTGSSGTQVNTTLEGARLDGTGNFLIGNTNGTSLLSVGSTSQFQVNSSGVVVQYKNVATTGWGVPAIYGVGRATAQTVANGTVATYTVGASDGSFEVSANILVTTSSAENFTATVAYTDEGNTSRTLTLNFQTIAGVFGTDINFANGAVPYEGVVVHLRCKASTAITIKTAAGGTYTGCTYNVEGIIKQTA